MIGEARAYRDEEGRTGWQFMCDLFRFEFCEECHKGARGHVAVPFMGGWFAACKKAPEGAE